MSILLRKMSLALLLLLGGSVFAQASYTLSGYVRDGLTGEAMIGATIFAPESRRGAYTNEYGFYSLSLPAGEQVVQFRFAGYAGDTINLELSEKLRYDVELFPVETTTDEVVISSRSASDNVQSTEMGVTQLSIQEVKKLPVLFGETDVLKTIQLLPGVKAAGDGNSGFFVRGGGADQNLILLDEAPVYNASHLLGFFSVFNGDAINSTKLYKGNQPAEYGGRLSSTLDIRMKEGNAKDFGVSGGIGLISSRLTVEGPIAEDKASFMVSGRRTYADAFLQLSPDSNLNSSTLYFYDLNAKANWRIGEKDQIFLSGYFGRDNFGLQDQFGIDWGNATGTLRWNHLFNDRLFLNSSLIYSDYDYAVNIGPANASIQSGIQDYQWKEDLSFYANSRHTFKAGLDVIYHSFVPGVVVRTDEDGNENIASEVPERYALETAAYLSHEWKATERLRVNYGLRYSHFFVLGPGTTYRYDAEDQPIDSTSYGSGELVADYGGIEPRVTATYLLDGQSSVKASYARNRQYVHLLSNSTSTTPTDVWLPSSESIQPEIADQLAVGYFRNFADNRYEASVELYYKDLQNQIEYENGADLLLNADVESQLVFGRGYAYGAEFMVKKSLGKFTGWASYTWSRTWREFEEINEGEAFPARQDRIHDLTLVGVYEPTPAWSFSGAFTYFTGDAVTMPSGSYAVNGQVLPLYTERNGARLPAYHRLDLSATWYGKNPKSTLNVSLYNAYGRKNVFALDFQPSEDDPGTLEAVKTYLFRWVPSVTWNFEF